MTKIDTRIIPVRCRLRLLSLLLLAVLALLPTRGAYARSASGDSGNGVAGQSSTPEARSPEANKQETDENEEYRHSAVVRAFGAKLGMNPEQAATAFEIINFAVLAVLIGLFLAKSLPRTFRTRTGHIQKHLVDARMATEEAAARIDSVEERLSKLDGEIAAMRTQAEREWEAEERRVQAAVEEEKQKILAAAEQEIAAATTQARRLLQQFAAELTIDQAAKRLVIDAETDRLLVQSFARRLSGDDERSGQN